MWRRCVSRLSLGALLILSIALLGCGHSISGANPLPPGPPPPPDFAYLSNTGDNAISEFAINNKNGELNFIGKDFAGTGGGTKGLAATASGKFVYAADQQSSEIFGFIVQKNGQLSPTAQGHISTGTGTAPLTIATAKVPPANFLYVIDSANKQVLQYSIDNATGALKSLAPGVGTGNGPVSIAVSPINTALFVANSVDGTITGYAIGKNGKLTATGFIGSLGTAAGQPLWLAAQIGGAGLFVADADGFPGGTVAQFTITGTSLEFVNIFPTGNSANFPLGVTVNPVLPFVYAANGANDNVSKFQIQAAGLAPAVIITGTTDAVSVATDPRGRFLYIVDRNDARVFQGAINPTTGDVTPIGSGFVSSETPPNPFSSPFQMITLAAPQS